MSGSGGADDPFGWSNERLIQELCTSQRSWPAAQPKKWPDPDLLAAKLQEHDLDGSDLLCYEDLMGQGAFESLCSDLGITKIPHKASLRVALRLFQKRSPGYRAWKEEQAAIETSQAQTEDTRHSLSPRKARIETNGEPHTAAPGALNGNGRANLHDVRAGNGGPQDKAAIQENGSTNGRVTGDSLPVVMEIDVPASPPSFPAQTSKKRKRLVPTNISSTPVPRKLRVDPFGDMSAGIPDRLWQDSAIGAYLGGWALPKQTLLQGTDPLDPTNNDDAGTDDFGWFRPMSIPAGRRLQVHHAVRRYLQPASASVAKLGRARRPLTNNGSGVGLLLEDEDEVLPALGESDDEGYDTETWEAMEQEANERSEQKKRKNDPLSVVAFDTIIADAVRLIEAKWADKKLSKLRRREHSMWTSARSAGLRKFLMNKALKEADRFEQRIDKMVQEMRQVEWRNEKEVRTQAAVLDANIEDRQYALWQSRLYSSPTEPSKPAESKKVPRRRPSAPRARRKIEDDDEEILTSSSSDDNSDGRLQDFVVNDEDADELATLSDGAMDVSDDSMDHPVKADLMDIETAKQPDALPDRTSVGPLLVQAAPKSASTLASEFPLEDLSAIAKKGVSYWEAAGDVTRLLCTIFSSADSEQLARLFHILSLNVDDFWQKFCAPTLAATSTKDEPGAALKTEDDATAFTRYFFTFLTVHDVAPRDFHPQDDDVHQKITQGRASLGSFCVKMRTIAPYFSHLTTSSLTQPAHVAKSATPGVENGRVEADVVSIESDNEDKDEGDLELCQVHRVARPEEPDDDDNDVQISSSFIRRGRLVGRDQGAQSLRDRDKARQLEQENRRKVLYENLAQTGQLSSNKARLIINEAKDKNHGFVYVNSWIGQNIRDHQIDGVRFMWNQIIAPPESRQGCLLAHTMGLGKTMQVITLLVAITEAAKSPDESVSSQIPEDLRESKTLILCPPGLVINWQDELLVWAKDGSLGSAYHVASNMDKEFRLNEIRDWAENGGTMVLGYNMFAQLEKDFGRTAMDLLENTPNIVIADEAHIFKNPSSKIHDLTKNFRTSARIAMTGSPLANSVNEYHVMINWVAPNYLAAREEFNATYANPIKEGFYRDSTTSQRRCAYKMLKVLKDTVAPKIHRVTVSNLQGVLPEKREFILYLPLTPLQMKVYHTFIRLMKQPRMIDDIQTTFQMWSLLIYLTLLLGHPKIFKDRLLEMKKVQTDSKTTGLARPGTLPKHMIDELLTTVGTRDIENLDYSSKIVVLMGILDEAKRVGEKVLVFSQSKLVLDYLQVEFQRQNRLFSRLDGDTAVNKRQAMIKDFNSNTDEVYLISTTAGGVGLNIQGANRVVIFDFKWNPMHEQQAIGRAYRIGQKRTVFVYWLIMGETFETVLHDQAVFKTQLASRVVDKKNPSAWADQIRNYTKDPAIMALDPSLSSRFKGCDPVLDALLANGTATQPRICKIVSTDTFEEEEPEAKLSPEELTDADNMISMNKMRIKIVKDGAGGEIGGSRRSLETMRGPPLERTQVDGSGFPPAVAPSRPNPGGVSLPIPQPVPPSLVLGSQAPQAQPHPPMQIATSNTLPPPPMHIPTQQLDNGVGDFVQGQYVDGDPLFLDPVPEPPVQEPVHETVPSLPSALAGSPEELVRALKMPLISGYIKTQRTLTAQKADMMARKAVMEIDRTFQLAGVPARAQWGRLKALVSREPSLVEMIVYGAIAPAKLATMAGSDESEFVSLVISAFSEMRTAGPNGVYNVQDTPNCCTLFGSLETLERVVERKLYEGATSFPKATGDPIAGSLARELAVSIGEATPDNPMRKTVLARYAIRAFRDPVFANALVSGDIDLHAWPSLSVLEQAKFMRSLYDKHGISYPRPLANDSPAQPARERNGIPYAPTKGSTDSADRRHSTKFESLDDAANARTLDNVPSRPSSTSSGRSRTGVTAGTVAAKRVKDPDHVQHHLHRSQNRGQRPHNRSTGGPGATVAGGEPSRRVSEGAEGSADLLAMREVMERRERRSIVPSPSATGRPSATAPSFETPGPYQARAPPLANQTTQTQRSRLERSLLEADRQQHNAKRERANKPKILPPPNLTSKAGDNVLNPFVLDD
ncbi:hypothetical protein SCUCBS95973_001920 [Sporothrix curviconia]|uniref:Snf2 family helicase n=1 Tax=Sporothrix curviconia TaxID=1260050 RepID=A0ABP0B2P1_9PEZI